MRFFYIGVTGAPVMTPKPTPSMMTPKPTPAPIPAPVMTPKPTPAPVMTPVIAPVTPPVTTPTSPPGVSVMTDKTSYSSGETIVATYTNTSPLATNWIGLYNNENFLNVDWGYTDGTGSGTINFSSAGLSGTYFLDMWAGTDPDVALASSSLFTVITVPTSPPVPTNPPTFPAGVSIATSKASYAVGEQIVVTFSNNAPTALDWIGIYDTAGNNFSWDSTGGIMTGTMIFGTGLANFPFPTGTYLAEYYNSDDALIAEVLFTIA